MFYGKRWKKFIKLRFFVDGKELGFSFFQDILIFVDKRWVLVRYLTLSMNGGNGLDLGVDIFLVDREVL